MLIGVALRYDNAMSRNEPIHKLFSRITTAMCGIFLAVSGAIALAQNALDGSLHIGSGGVNTAIPPQTRTIRRETGLARDLSQALGYSSNNDFLRQVGSATGNRPAVGSMQRTTQVSVAPVVDTTSWKKKDPLRFDSQGLSLSTNLSKALDATETPYATFRTRRGDTGHLTANGLRGVKVELDRDRIGANRMSLYETARLRQDVQKNTIQSDAIGIGLQNPFQPYQQTDAVMATRKLPPKTRTANQSAEPFDNRIYGYSAIMQEVKQRFETKLESLQKPVDNTGKKDGSSNDEKIVSVYDSLKYELSQDKKQVKAIKPAQGVGDAAKEGATGADKVDSDNKVRDEIHMTLDDYALVLQHGKRIDSMTTDEKNRFNELLSEGQRAMYEGNAFVAEKRFQVALAIRPNDPLAIAGMLHCQISANLAGSAALTLHELFTQHPEMMDVKWGPQTIPPRPRLEKALLEAGRRLANGRDPAQFGLLQAYIGHLLDNQDAVKSGLFELRGTPGDESMAVILKKLWIEPAADSAAQKTQEPAQAKDSATPQK